MPLDLAHVLAERDQGSQLTTGVTVSAAGTLVTVNVDGSPLSFVRALSYVNPAPGDVVLVAITADGRRYALGAVATGTTPTPPTPPPGPPTTGIAVFPAIGAGTYRNARLRTDRTDVIQGDWQGAFGLNQGAWVYGTTPAGSLSGATITAAEIFIDRRAGGWNAAQNIGLYLHNFAMLPATTPPRIAGPQTIGALAVGAQAWLPIPITWAQQIVAATARGLGIYTAASDPYIVCASLSASGQTGALRLTWSR